MCFDVVYNFSPKHFSFWKELSEMLSSVYKHIHVKYPLILSYFNDTLIFLIYFLKTLKY